MHERGVTATRRGWLGDGRLDRAISPWKYPALVPHTRGPLAMKGEHMGVGKPRRTVRGTDNGTRMVSMSDVAFAGTHGQLLWGDVQRVSAGLIHVDHAVPELTRRPDGILSLKVNNTTIDVIAGRADVIDHDDSNPAAP